MKALFAHENGAKGNVEGIGEYTSPNGSSLGPDKAIGELCLPFIILENFLVSLFSMSGCVARKNPGWRFVL